MFPQTNHDKTIKRARTTKINPDDEKGRLNLFERKARLLSVNHIMKEKIRYHNYLA
tara:strand:- start:826 stop:993 length:168 start_codon:yes stop_codon:yes gene_type:complete